MPTITTPSGASLVLPEFQDATNNYLKAQFDGDTLHIGDHVGQDEKAVTVRAKVGCPEQFKDTSLVSPDLAYDLARNAGLRLLSTLHHYCEGDLGRVDKCVKMTGYVNGHPDFQGHGKVINGCSDVLVEALGDKGRHARSCIGAGSSPAAVTCELSVKFKPADRKRPHETI